jgi:hypothetical protein
MGFFSKSQASSKPVVQAPRVPGTYYTDMLTEAGYPCTADNIDGLCRQVAELFLVKAQQFISSRSHAQSDAFVRAHRLSGPATPEFNQHILDDLVGWDSDVAPYIGDLPARIRRILLERREGTILASPRNQSLKLFMNQRRG